jgi:hypothetical protein
VKSASNANAEKDDLEQAAFAYGRPGEAKAPPKDVHREIDGLFNSPEAKAIKEKIYAVGWNRLQAASSRLQVKS